MSYLRVLQTQPVQNIVQKFLEVSLREKMDLSTKLVACGQLTNRSTVLQQRPADSQIGLILGFRAVFTRRRTSRGQILVFLGQNLYHGQR
jgi:hypothetical protein